MCKNDRGKVNPLIGLGRSIRSAHGSQSITEGGTGSMNPSNFLLMHAMDQTLQELSDLQLQPVSFFRCVVFKNIIKSDKKLSDFFIIV